MSDTNIDNRQSESSIKQKTARTIKWNTIDRFSSQVLYAVTGVVLANVLSKEDFGLVGAILVFQAFATLFVDSGFGAALLQKKSPTDKDYSTVFWFNLIVSIVVYALLWVSAPFIADIFQGDQRLIPLSRVMFLCFVINGLAIVQTNRLMKAMNVKMIALSNLVGLTISGAIGIWMALTGWGPWALVWQSIILASVKTIWLWSIGRWVPRYGFHMDSMRQIYRVGLGVFSSSFLNTVFLNIYSFIIGAYYNLAALGNYTQADKWSKMGSASISQILTASFVPLLSQYQDDGEKYRALIGKINRFTSFILFPFMCWLIVMAEPVFHLMFGTKWDTAIPLFQILLLRGIFTVLTSLYNNYILSLGHARSLVVVEFVKDALTLIAIVSTIAMQSVEALVWGQMVAGAATYLFILWLASRNTGYSKRRFLIDMAPYALLTILTMIAMWSLSLVIANDILLLFSQLAVGAIVYYAVLRVTGSTILMEAQSYITSHFRKK